MFYPIRAFNYPIQPINYPIRAFNYLIWAFNYPIQPIDTAYRICSSRQFTTKSRGGTKGKKFDDLSAKLVENRPNITLSEQKDVLHEAGG